MSISFYDELPPQARVQRQRGKWTSFFDACRNNPGAWAKFPKQGKSNVRSAAAHQIKAGNYRGIDAGEFEAVNRNNTLYVRFVGEAPDATE